jgi:hypothetical protein
MLFLRLEHDNCDITVDITASFEKTRILGKTTNAIVISSSGYVGKVTKLIT